MNEQQLRTLELLNISTIPELDLIVPRGSLPEKLFAEIASADAVKLLIAGQRGMGKTTELRRLVELLHNEQSYLPIFVQFGSQESVTDVALILIMANHLYAEPKAGISAAAMERIQEWQDSVEIAESVEEGRQGLAEIGGKIPLLKASGGIHSKRGKSITRKRSIKKTKTELLDRFNELLDRAKHKAKKRVVFVIDDIDKVQDTSSIEGTFIHSAQIIGEIECPCIFTVPITYATSTYLRIATLPYSALYRVPAVSLISPDEQMNQEAFMFMRSVFEKRMPFNPLTQAQMDTVLRYSGGVLVDAMRMLRGICKDAALKGYEQVPDELIEEYFQYLVDDYKYVFDTPALWRKLATFSQAEDADIYVTDESIPELLYKMIVIEYRDKKMWFNLHPAARRLYEQNKMAIDRQIQK